PLSLPAALPIFPFTPRGGPPSVPVQRGSVEGRPAPRQGGGVPLSSDAVPGPEGFGGRNSRIFGPLGWRTRYRFVAAFRPGFFLGSGPMRLRSVGPSTAR